MTVPSRLGCGALSGAMFGLFLCIFVIAVGGRDALPDDRDPSVFVFLFSAAAIGGAAAGFALAAAFSLARFLVKVLGGALSHNVNRADTSAGSRPLEGSAVTSERPEPGPVAVVAERLGVDPSELAAAATDGEDEFASYTLRVAPLQQLHKGAAGGPASDATAVIFRKPLVMGCALGIALLAYFGFASVAGLAYPFACGAGVGLLWFLAAVWFNYLPHGLRVDDVGITDLHRRLTIRWDEINGIRFDVVHKTAGTPTAYRFASLESADGRNIRFGATSGAAPHGLDAVNTEHAAIALGLIVDRLRCAQLFPESWSRPLTEAGSPAQAMDAAADSEAAPAVKPLRKNVAGAFLVGLKIFPKAGALAVKLLKAVKPGAALVTLGVYSLISWKFAIALFLLIGIHEFGRVAAMWRCGLQVRGVYFIPFVGAAAVAKQWALARWQNAYIAINGPIWGTALALTCLAAYVATGQRHPTLGAMAAWGSLINLFNLLPVLPLDGGRILTNLAYSWRSAIGRIIVLATLLAGAAFAYLAGYELLVLVAILGFSEYLNHLSSLPVGNAVRQLSPQHPMNLPEAQHFDDLVSTVQSKSVMESRLNVLEHQLREGLQTPMTVRQAGVIFVGYFLLVALLLATLLWTNHMQGIGSPWEFLQ